MNLGFKICILIGSALLLIALDYHYSSFSVLKEKQKDQEKDKEFFWDTHLKPSVPLRPRILKHDVAIGFYNMDNLSTILKPLFPQTRLMNESLHLLIKDYEGNAYTLQRNVSSIPNAIAYLASETLVNEFATPIQADGTWRLMKQCLGGDGLGDWRPILAAVAQAVKMYGPINFTGKHVYAFGVSYGYSIMELWQILHPKLIWGFDSFAGLPNAEPGAEAIGLWHTGAFASDPRSNLTALLGSMNVGWIEGFYSDSLVDTLVTERNMLPALYVDIDVDLYSSSILALDFMFRNHLIVPGTIIGYDDWWVEVCQVPSYRYKSPLEMGEGLAHQEMTQKYDVEFLCVAGLCHGDAVMTPSPSCNPYTGWGAIFMVVSIGQGKATTGFTMTPEALTIFKQTDGRCKVL